MVGTSLMLFTPLGTLVMLASRILLLAPGVLMKMSIFSRKSNVEPLGLVTVSLTGRDDQGDPKGTATLPDGTKWTAYFYHEAAKNTTWLDILDGRGSMVYCAFTAQGLSGTGARGSAYYVKDVNAKEDPAKIGECSAQLK